MITNTTTRRAQFELERVLRRRILESPREQRLTVATAAYAELFDRFPTHSVFQATPEDRIQKGRRSAGLIQPLTRGLAHILEVGCGRGDGLVALARLGHTCVGVELSQRMIEMCPNDSDVKIVFGAADDTTLPDVSFDVVFSEQVLEHVHPDDVPQHFAEAFRVLRPGGILAVETPNRRTGPQDISRGFVRVAEGLHLKEWSVGELIEQFRHAGFARVRGLMVPHFLARRSRWIHRLSRVPAVMKYAQDLVLALVPGMGLRTFMGKVMALDDIFLFGRKPLARARPT